MANEPTSNNEGGTSSVIHSYLAVVTKVYLKSDKELDKENDYIKIYNDNKNFDSNDIRFLGAIEFARESAIINEGYAFPFDKNNMTYPILGETVLIIEMLLM